MKRRRSRRAVCATKTARAIPLINNVALLTKLPRVQLQSHLQKKLACNFNFEISTATDSLWSSLDCNVQIEIA